MMMDLAKKNVTKAEWFSLAKKSEIIDIQKLKIKSVFPFVCSPPCDDAYSQKRARDKKKKLIILWFATELFFVIFCVS